MLALVPEGVGVFFADAVYVRIPIENLAVQGERFVAAALSDERISEMKLRIGSGWVDVNSLA